MKKAVSILSVIVLLGGMMMLSLSGCFAAKYHVDYGGQKDSFVGAKDSYRAGATVKLCYPEKYIGTDTDYSFVLDGENVNADYQQGKGFIIRFTMPDHDVTFGVRSVNSMVYVPDSSATLTFSSFDGGGYSYNAVIEDENIADYTVRRDYGNQNHEEMEGASYDVIFSFIGLSPGKTTLKIEARSPIIEPEDYTYELVVDDDLNVTVTEITE